QCASLPVPVSYEDASTGTVDMAVIRARARDRSRRLGTLIVNFGGPGDAGTGTLRTALTQVPQEGRARVGLDVFDHRGDDGVRALRAASTASTRRRPTG